MTTKHTPGPWHWEQTPSNHLNVTDSDNDMVCEVYGTRKADAYLIAAAPELLEALDALVKTHSGGACFKAIVNARAAIRKAKGGAL